MSSVGPEYMTLGSSVARGSGDDIPWNQPDLAITAADDGVYATASLTGQSSQWLKMTTAENNFAAIPVAAAILGIEVTVKRFNATGGQVADDALRIVKGGVIQSVDIAGGISNWPTLDTTTVTYGGPTSLWGTTWLYTDIRNAGANFGFALACSEQNIGSATPSVDWCKIKVYYTTQTKLPHPPSMQRPPRVLRPSFNRPSTDRPS